MRVSETCEQRDARMEIDSKLHARYKRTTHTDLKLRTFHYYANYNYSIHPSVVFVIIDESCRFCRAFKFKNESPGMCCAGRKLKFPELHPPLEQIEQRCRYNTGTRQKLSLHYKLYSINQNNELI